MAPMTQAVSHQSSVVASAAVPGSVVETCDCTTNPIASRMARLPKMPRLGSIEPWGGTGVSTHNTRDGLASAAVSPCARTYRDGSRLTS